MSNKYFQKNSKNEIIGFNNSHRFHHHKIYQPEHIPPDWQFAEIHANSTKPGFLIKGQPNYKCPCCLNHIKKMPISYCEDNKQLAFLGQGFPLIYNFLKYCIIMLGAVIISNCALSIYLNIQQFVCQTPDYTHKKDTRLLDNANQLPTCQGTPFNQLAFLFTGNIQNQNIRQILNVISFVTHALILIYFRQQQSSLAEYLNERNTTISDFSVLIKYIPKGNSQNKKKLQQLILKICPDVNIMEILIIQNLREYFILERELNIIINQKKRAIKQFLSDQQKNSILIKLKEKEDQIENLTLNMQKNEIEYFQGTAFLILNTELEKKKVIQAINNCSQQILLGVYPNSQLTGKKIKAQQAGEPNQINWENVHFIRKQRIFATILSWFVFVIFLGAIMGIYYIILNTKTKRILNIQHLRQESENVYSQIVSARILGYFLVILINFLNKFVISDIAHKLTDYQRHILYTDLQFSFALKYMLGMFFTTALMTLLVEAGILSNFSDTLGVIEQQTFMFMFNAIFSPVVWLINPYNIIGDIKRKIYKGANNLTQKQANQIMELHPYEIGKRYAENMKTMWFTFLYIQLIPVGAIFSFLGIILYYLVDKYVLLRRSSVKQAISANLSTSMITILQFTLVLKPLGEIVFSYQLYGQIALSSIIMIILGVIFMCLPLKSILKCIFAQKFNMQQKTYEQAKDTFMSNYITSYPLRKQYTQNKKNKDGTLNFITQKNLDTEHPIFLKILQSQIKNQQTKNRLIISGINNISNDIIHK